MSLFCCPEQLSCQKPKKIHCSALHPFSHMNKFIPAFLLTIFALPAANAQSRFQPEDIWKLSYLSDPQPSPDGKNILFSVKRTNLEENRGNSDLWIMRSDGKGQIALLESPQSEFNARWRPDGKRIGFLRSEGGAPQLFEIDPDGSRLERLSSEAGGIEGFEYARMERELFSTVLRRCKSRMKNCFRDFQKQAARCTMVSFTATGPNGLMEVSIMFSFRIIWMANSPESRRTS